MGKGDKKTRRGKIVIGSFGVRRQRKQKKTAIPAIKVPKASPKKAQEPKPKKVVEVVVEEPVVITEPIPVNEPVAEVVTQTELPVEVKPAKPAPKKAAAKKTALKAETGEVKPKVSKAKKKTAEPAKEKPVEE